jgi:hypothetical protein
MVTDKDAIVSMVKAQSNMRIVLDRNSELKKALKTLENTKCFKCRDVRPCAPLVVFSLYPFVPLPRTL